MLTLMELPEELVCEVMHHLEHSELAKFSTVCKDLYRIGNEDGLWRRKGFLKRSSETNNFAGAATVPPPRLCHTAVKHNDKIHIFGGHNTETDSQRFSEVKNDLFSFDIKKKTWEKCSFRNLPAKTEHSAILHDDKLWMFGGYSGNSFSNLLFMINFSTQQCNLIKTTGELPNGRSAHVGAVFGKKYYVFGGWDGAVQYNDIFALKLDTLVWAKIPTEIENSPHPRCSHTVAVSNSRKSMFIFGGYGGKVRNYLNDLWEFCFERNTWTLLTGRGEIPSPRSRMRMVEWNGKLFVFGGWDRAVHYDDLFEYDIESSVWTKLNIKDPQDDTLKIGQHSMTVSDNVLYIFGGYNQKERRSTNDLYAFRLGKSSKMRQVREKPYHRSTRNFDFKLSKHDLSNEMEIEA